MGKSQKPIMIGAGLFLTIIVIATVALLLK